MARTFSRDGGGSGRRPLALLSPLLLAACAALPPPRPVPLEPGERRLVAAAEAAMERGEEEEARRAAGALLAEYPASVDGRRLLQNLRLAAGESWRLYEEARAAYEREPEDPGALYLLARLIPDRRRQRELFRRVLALDPSQYFGAYALAVVSLDLSELSEAEEAARRAAAIRPGDRRARRLLATVLGRAGRNEEARAIFRRLLAADPGDPRTALASAEELSREGREAEALGVVLDALPGGRGAEALLARAFELLDVASGGEALLARAEAAARRHLERSPRSVAARLVLARAALRSGDPDLASREYARAVEEGAGKASLREDRIEAAILGGEYGLARRLWEAGLPAMLDRPENRRRKALGRLRAALSAAGRRPGEPGTLRELSRALSGLGFHGPAAAVALEAARRAPDRRDLREEAEELARWGRFLREVESRVRSGYRAFDAGGEPGDLDARIEELRRLSVDLLGHDVLAGIPVERYPFVGSVIRSDREGAPEDWERHGTLFVLGRRKGGPVEGTILRHVGWFSGAVVAGVAHTLSLGEGQSLPSHVEAGGRSIAGFTLPGWIGLNLDVTNEWEEERERLARAAKPAELWPAPDAERRLSLWFPHGVRARLAARCPEDADAALLASLAHEEGHLLDADRSLPLLAHLPRLLFEVVRHGFSEERLEAALERSAEAHALRESPFPRVALLNALSFLPFRLTAPPHSVGYHDLVRHLIEEIDRHPARYPSIDRRYNILEQLDRLTDREMALLRSRAE